MTGYRRLVSSDPREQELRDAWHKAKAAVDPVEAGSLYRFQLADKALTDFLWRRAWSEREADRLKHPKAKRNLPVGAMGQSDGGRFLP